MRAAGGCTVPLHSGRGRDPMPWLFPVVGIWLCFVLCSQSLALSSPSCFWLCAALQVTSVSPSLASGQRWSPSAAARHGTSCTVPQVRDASPLPSATLGPVLPDRAEGPSADIEMCLAGHSHCCSLPPALTPLLLFCRSGGDCRTHRGSRLVELWLSLV